MGAAELGSPESSLSPRSDLSVPSNPARSAHSLSSYNPFEDEDDTGSTVSEKEDIKAKKLVNKRFPLVSTSLPLSLLSVQGLTPSALKAMHEACRRWPGCQLVDGLWLLDLLGREAPVNKLWLLFLCPLLTHVKVPAHQHRKMGVPGGPAGSLPTQGC